MFLVKIQDAGVSFSQYAILTSIPVNHPIVFPIRGQDKPYWSYRMYTLISTGSFEELNASLKKMIQEGIFEKDIAQNKQQEQIKEKLERYQKASKSKSK